MSRSLPNPAAAAALAVLVLAGCGTSAPGDEVMVGVESSGSACVLTTTSVPAGSTTFSIRNTGDETTEFYVYREDGAIASEAEDIAPGLTRELTVDLDEGSYEVACKPGERDPGFRQALSVPAG